ncbi:MAG: hypothetical protein KDA81_22570, partial [Planctomycetaceae bacterium]|nr:hypothetical protein [Planctomycetaceae bacterium]
CVYYGDEVGLDGRHDPDCRKGFPWSEDLQDRELFSWYQQCIRLRQRHPTVTSQQPVLSVIADTAVVVRHSGLVAVLNPSNSAVEVDLSIPDGESMLDWQTKQPMLCRPWQLKARTAAVFEAADQTLRGVVK